MHCSIGPIRWKFGALFFVAVRSILALGSQQNVVLRGDSSSLPVGVNQVISSGFEVDPKYPDEIPSWLVRTGSSSHISIDRNIFHGGHASLRLQRQAQSDEAIELNQKLDLGNGFFGPIVLSAWTKAEAVTGLRDHRLAVKALVTFEDGTTTEETYLSFEASSHDWLYQEAVFLLPKRTVEVSLSCVMAGGHTGTVWVDDVSMRPFKNQNYFIFDDHPVAVNDSSPTFKGRDLALATSDGLQMNLDPQRGSISGIRIGSRSIDSKVAPNPLNGFVIHDATSGIWQTLEGQVTRDASDATILRQESVAPELSLKLLVCYKSTADRIVISADVEDTLGQDRAVTLYYIIPAPDDSWHWDGDLRASQVSQAPWEEWRSLTFRSLGNFGGLSRYPVAMLSNGKEGMALSYPINRPTVSRLVYNPLLKVFYIAFDLGLSKGTSFSPASAHVEFNLFRVPEPGNLGFRSALQGYYDRFTDLVTSPIKAEQQGNWVAFSDISSVPHIEDFGIGVHELFSTSQSPFAHDHGISPYRYLVEPYAIWLQIYDQDIDPSSYEDAMRCVDRQWKSADEQAHRNAEAILTSGMRDVEGKFYVHGFKKGAAPAWCDGPHGCFLFTVNSSPSFEVAGKPWTKARLSWDGGAAYQQWPQLGGEYFDSFCQPGDLDFDRNHWRNLKIPLSFSRTNEHRVGQVAQLAPHELVNRLTPAIRGASKSLMANFVLAYGEPWGANLFDYLGIEVWWANGSRLSPDSDEMLMYRRTLAGYKPYGLLLYADPQNAEIVRPYFEVALFYGFYPGMTYWENPVAYERDRPLFKKYMPLIRILNASRWQPVTNASARSDGVLIERFGSGSTFYFTLRNMTNTDQRAKLDLDLDRLGLNHSGFTVRRMIEANAELVRNGSVLSLPMGSNRVEMIEVNAM